MARDISVSLLADLTAAVTAPGYLLQIDFTSPLRACTRTTLTFQGASFVERGFTVQGLMPSVDSSEAVDGTLTMHDPDAAVEQLVLSEGIEEKRIRVWAYSGDVSYSSQLDLLNPVLLYDGYGSEAQIDPARATVTITLQAARSLMSVSPRVRMTKETGFTHLPVSGQEYEFGGEKWRAESD
jgi:hypothetical protein